MQDMPDASLAMQAARGDHHAFELIMRRYNRTLYRAARSILKDASEAEEAVQECYIRAYEALGGFRGESSLSTWLTRIAINKALERLRKRKRQLLAVPTDNIIDLENRLHMSSAETMSTETPERAFMRRQMRRPRPHREADPVFTALDVR